MVLVWGKGALLPETAGLIKLPYHACACANNAHVLRKWQTYVNIPSNHNGEYAILPRIASRNYQINEYENVERFYVLYMVMLNCVSANAAHSSHICSATRCTLFACPHSALSHGKTIVLYVICLVNRLENSLAPVLHPPPQLV